ncbi:hypothetical protein [Pseudotabrizicola sp.]|uniref:hypothetical protein n=1 Tax=Pseudotabrizicola sp. TaxID=2939647 RepID=UPI0027284B65|nr:hypothetical protein [Pseudotabrizicola sp.]MDO8884153.1 hypothetical protein [Pseudotabrizicola sp.]
MNGLPMASAAALSLLLMTSQGHAQAAVVTRCNANVDGTFVPALFIVIDGQTQVITNGTSGLTRRILFDEALALDFVRQLTGNTGRLVYVDCSDVGTSAIPVSSPPPPPDDIDDGDDSPGGGDDCGSCCYF